MPGGPGMPGPPNGPGGPYGPGGPAVRRRITDAFARLGPWSPAPGAAAVGPDGAAVPYAEGNDAAPSGKSSARRNRALVVGAGVVAAAAVVGVIVVPKLLGPTDPGCKSYAGSTLTAYNKTISDLNAQAKEAPLAEDMATTIADLKGAIAQAQSASVKSALDGLLAELKTVQADIGSGSVPAATVSALNAASTKADNAC
jgi:hypothetical protein